MGERDTVAKSPVSYNRMLPGSVRFSRALQPTNTSANLAQAGRQFDCVQAMTLREGVHVEGVYFPLTAPMGK